MERELSLPNYSFVTSDLTQSADLGAEVRSEILRRCASGDAARLKRISGRFSGMIIPGETISIRHAPAGSGVIRFDVLTAGGQAAISQGFAVVEDVL